MIKQKMIYGIHAVVEALDASVELDKIYIKKGSNNPEIDRIRKGARQLSVPVFEVPAERLNRFTQGSHQGVVALLSPITYTRLDYLIANIFEEGRLPFIVVLDGVTDVRNFGAIARTCECVGVDAIVIPEKGSVSVTADAVNASAGALMRIPVCREKNVVSACRFLQESGLNLIGASEKAEKRYTSADLTGAIALVMGAEDKGLSSAVMNLIDTAISIPQMGNIGSLNVSVACGIILYEVIRQKGL